MLERVTNSMLGHQWYYYDKKDSAAALDVWKRWLALYPNAPAAGDVSKQIAKIEGEKGKGSSVGKSGS